MVPRTPWTVLGNWRYGVAALVVLGLSTSLYLRPQTSAKWLTETMLPSSMLTSSSAFNDCFPLNEHGHLQFREAPIHWIYETYNPDCKAVNGLALALTEGSLPQAMHNRTILLIGDSVDRGLVDHLGGVPTATVEIKTLTDYPPQPANITNGQRWKGYPRYTTIDSAGLLFSNYFFYGMDNEDFFEGHIDHIAPGPWRERWEYMTRVWRPQNPDLVIVQAGLWDLMKWHHVATV